MEREKIISELKEQFDLEKKRLCFKATFEEINNIFYIEDMALSYKFVSKNLSRQIINHMIEGMYSWINELYVWIYPPSTNMICLHEHKKLDDNEKKEILKLIDKIMYLFRKNKRIAFEGLIKKEEANFIDEILEFRTKEFGPVMAKFLKKFEHIWKEEFLKNTKK